MWNAAVIGVVVTAIPDGPREGKTNADGLAPAAAPKESEHVGRSSH